MEMNKVRKISAKRSDFMGTYLNLPEKEDYMSITEWENGEGFDVTINNLNFNIHRDELEGLWYLTRKLDYEFKG